MDDVSWGELARNMRSRPLPPEPAGMRNTILDAYDSLHRSRPAREPSYIAYRQLAAAAVAAVITIITYIGTRTGPGSKPELPVARRNLNTNDQFTQILVRASILRERLRAADKADRDQVAAVHIKKEAAPSPSVEDKNKQTIRRVAALMNEPAESIFRLVAAESIEAADPDTAKARYRELSRDFPDTTANRIAGRRLEQLGR